VAARLRDQPLTVRKVLGLAGRCLVATVEPLGIQIFVALFSRRGIGVGRPVPWCTHDGALSVTTAGV
jgi:hypothetical protein